MTGYTVHTGSTEKFSESWDRIFSGASKKAKGRKKAAKAKPPAARKKKKKK